MAQCSPISPALRAMQARDRYIHARFPGFPRSARDLADVPAVLKAAAIYFDDGLVELARELLWMASESHGGAEALWLARLELAFLARDCEDYATCEGQFLERYPFTQHFGAVRQLGDDLANEAQCWTPPKGWLRHSNPSAACLRACLLSAPVIAHPAMQKAAA
jgi:hypothetical protein